MRATVYPAWISGALASYLETSCLYLFDGNGPVDGRQMNDRRGIAEFNPSTVFIPGFARIVAKAGLTTHRRMTI